MGKRYSAIVRHLGHEVVGVELDGTFGSCVPSVCDGLIIATPTDTHAEILRIVKDWGRPVLCEKPVCKDLSELERLVWALKAAGTRVEQVNQFEFMNLKDDDEGDTTYDYWNSGKDGLYWDCISPISLAKGKIELKAKSPIWRCQINGRLLNIAGMDEAYVAMVARWLVNPRSDYERILSSHRKVCGLMESQCHAS